MGAGYLEYILLGTSAYMVMTKARDDNDDKAKRILIGVGVGLLAGYKGPEMYKKLVEMKNSTKGKIAQEKLIAAAVGAGLGYFVGDKVVGYAKKLTA
jgi:hypothetical protein